MAAGEHIAVRSQTDLEVADVAHERDELTADPVADEAELTAICHTHGRGEQAARRCTYVDMGRARQGGGDRILGGDGAVGQTMC
ncbi:VIT1/CCC1 transporter family protein [Sphingomonas sanguinis]|uniref:VIT1/CCC1 transporter family protein n=1 Tax=Sphingomonas sanguinis TaxID=33051 RepID=UPI0035A74245